MSTTARRIIEVQGADSLTFLQGLVSNDVLPLAKHRGIVWAALLTPQGKYLSDFFVVNIGKSLLLDLPESLADLTLQRLSMYRLRADVGMIPSRLRLGRGLDAAPDGGFPDPRHPALGWRHYAEGPQDHDVDWDAIRVAHVIPESGVELVQGESYILEAGFEALHGVDFRKGCYVGQEVTARMKHKTDLRKGLVRIKISAQVPIGAPINTEDGKEVGTVFTQSGGRAIAHLRLDRAQGPMFSGAALIALDP